MNGNSIDFTNPDAARAVTHALLLNDFQLDLDLPTNRLCPPIPNRLNYIHWIEDLVAATRPIGLDKQVVGIDIGTGASVIYPALTCRLQPSWKFLALEIDSKSIECAIRNIHGNQLQDQIQLLTSDVNDARLLTQHALFNDPGFYATFTICNPPFYESIDDLHHSSLIKSKSPNGINTGSSSELITPGGDFQFTSNLLLDSLLLKSKIQWFSTMFGKLSSLLNLIELLRAHQIDNYAITELVQGQTRRWALAWSFQPWRPPSSVSRSCKSPALQNVLPKATSTTFRGGDWHGGSIVIQFCEEFGVDWEWIDVKSSILLKVTENTWSRQARRRLVKPKLSTTTTSSEVVMMIESRRSGANEDSIDLIWRYGNDAAIWTSLLGKLTRSCTFPHSSSSRQHSSSPSAQPRPYTKKRRS